jgi:hypothetical protein
MRSNPNNSWKNQRNNERDIISKTELLYIVMNEYNSTPQHDWNYFLALDDDVAQLSRYLEITEKNFESYSIELARILFVAASEVDVIAKGLCKRLDNNSTADNISKYRKTILLHYPQIASVLVEMPRFGLTLNPWQKWEEDKSPIWWGAYTNVKHHRNIYFFQANLKNALDSVAGLFVLLLFFYREETQKATLNPAPVLFKAGPPFRLDYSFYSPPATFYILDE